MSYEFTKLVKISLNVDDFGYLLLPISKENFDKGEINGGKYLSSEDIDFVKKVASIRDFKCECGENLMISGLPKSNLKGVILHGLGEKKKCDAKEECEKEKCKKLSRFEEKGGSICGFISSAKIEKLAISCLNIANVEESIQDEIALSIAFGIVQKNYTFSRYLTGEKAIEKLSKLSAISVIAKTDIAAKTEHVNLTLQSIYAARDLGNEPANIINPETYSALMKDEVKKIGNLDIEILGEKEMEKLGMHALLGVGLGSDVESKTVIIKYIGNPSAKDKIDIALVGKGVTFDSGGLSIKPANGMEEMKDDMAGSALAFASICLLARRKAKVNAICAVGLVENMLGGKAQKPGDIVKTMSGKTIEVLNTDAEGRLVLADVLYYTKTKFNPETIIDFATLTGAIVVALGQEYAGLFSNNDELAQNLACAGSKTGEKCWRLPLDKAFDAMIDSQFADVRNTGTGRGAGSITAAHFLGRFIDGHEKWAHIDIAGVGGIITSDKKLAKAGATGFGVKLVDDYIQRFVEKK